MGKNKIWPDRQTIRLQHWDYSSNGIYFVTICTKFMKPYFGRIKNSKNIYTPIGNYAIECWESLPTRYDYIELDTFIFMPNHMHGIIRINHDPNNDQKEKSEEDIKDLGSIIRGFKSGVKAYANKNEIDFAWHTRYYERIIRTTEELTNTRTYIQNNPSRTDAPPQKKC